MGKALVIVESPTKARTISKFLDDSYVVESSIGHIRDLPSSAKEIPEKLKKEKWARLGIDVENEFEPLYIVPDGKKKQVTKLKALLKGVDEVYLATDEDREGEAISWHLCEVLKPKVPKHRLVFHEITKEAIQNALDNPRQIDDRLVEAQETRRLLDRLYGYELSPVLWRKIKAGLSAGRVQSVAVRIIVERERERRRFVSAEYWDLSARFKPEKSRDDLASEFTAQLVELGGKRIASGKDFDEKSGKLKESASGQVALLGAQEAKDLAARLETSDWKTVKVERKPYTQRPAPPFTTSTLQQEANRKLRMSTRRTMQAAQRLYENGLITYMRTDSVSLAEQAVHRVRDLVGDLYGKNHLPDKPRHYKNKVKNAQEAHEAIRPSTEFHRPEEIKSRVGGDELRLYELIWKRTVACQMADAHGHRLLIQVSDGDAVFQASGKSIEFPGFLRAYVEGSDNPEAELADKETILPALEMDDPLSCEELNAKDHHTQPPARYTEASLVKELEANGVGRPSTYASIIDTIQRREYVNKQGNALVPTFTAFAVVQLMERFFSNLVDIQFTAKMEDDLDKVSIGERERLPYLREFYFGLNGSEGLQDLIKKDIDARESCTLPLGKDSEGRQIDIRVGKFGPYLERDDEKRASIPDGLPPDELDMEKAEDLLEKGAEIRELGPDPETGKMVQVKIGRFGPYVQLGDDEEKLRKSLPKPMEAHECTLDLALQLLSLPKVVGQDPENDNEDIVADLGRYGPYIKCGKESRSLKDDDDLFSLTEERAIQLLREEKPKGRGRFQAKVLKELGKHPSSEADVRLLEGRYGPYVTDGEVNASIPKGGNPDEVTLEQALELIQARIDRGGVKKKKKSTKKKAAKKKTTKKKTAAKKKKSTTKKKKSSKKATSKKQVADAD